jgi:hypothetical protein
MAEQEKHKSRSLKEWKGHISEFTAKCEFGTPEFQALSDFYSLANLSEETKSEEASQFIAGGHLTHLSHEARVGLILQRIALLEHSVDQKKATIPGYSKAYTDLTLAFEELSGAAKDDFDARFNNDPDPEQQSSYVHKIYVEMLDSIADNIFEVYNDLK